MSVFTLNLLDWFFDSRSGKSQATGEAIFLGKVQDGDQILLPGGKSLAITPGARFFGGAFYQGIYQLNRGGERELFARNLLDRGESDLRTAGAHRHRRRQPDRRQRVGAVFFLALSIDRVASAAVTRMVFKPAHGFRSNLLARPAAAGTTVMKNFFANIEFARPYFLWLLLLLPLLWLRLGDRRLWVLLARSAILALVILTLADPQTTSQQSRQEERIFAYDVSRSVPPSMRQWMAGMTKQLAPGNSDRIYTFAAAAKQSASLEQALGGDASASQPDKTNLENLLTALLALPAAPRSLFLFTDGWETDGNVERLLPAAAAAGIRIYPMLPAERPAIANVAVTKVIAPSQGMSGELLNLRVSLDNQNDRPVDGVLTLTRNGQPFKTDRIKLRPGSQSLSYQANLTDEALTAYRASFTAVDAAADVFTPDNHALAWVNVRTKAKVLIVNGPGGSGRYLDEIVRRQGFDVVSTWRRGCAAAGRAQSRDISTTASGNDFPPAYLASVERHVADGGSFIMLGADASFAQTSYRQTPIERILPVEPKEPPKQPEKNRAVVLVIDKSGSMRDDNRILYAKEAAKAVARQLKDIDLLGVVGFDDSPFVVVYLETMARLRGVIDNQIDRLKPGGQTYFLRH